MCDDGRPRAMRVEGFPVDRAKRPEMKCSEREETRAIALTLQADGEARGPFYGGVGAQCAVESTQCAGARECDDSFSHRNSRHWISDFRNVAPALLFRFDLDRLDLV